MPETLKRLIDIISFLPWIGEKTAAKLAFFLLKANGAYVKNFAKILNDLQDQIIECSHCHGMTDREHPTCKICDDSRRDKNVLCIVEDYLDMLSIDRVWIFKGRYHVLGGSISPIQGTLAGDLTIEHLFERIENEKEITELILATNPNIEWEVTSLYIIEHIPRKDVKITRLSKGLPHAGSIEYADEITLLNAFKGRV